MHTWTVEERETANGWRYRYRCTCGHTGRWWIDGNLADGDDHLYRAHGESL